LKRTLFAHYQAGDHLVSNNSDGSDAYALEAVKFESPSMPDENAS
jgi:hypothetical protein